MNKQTAWAAQRHACGDLQAICRVDVQTGDLLRQFSINPQKLDDQLRLVARRNPHHPILHPETHRWDGGVKRVAERWSRQETGNRGVLEDQLRGSKGHSFIRFIIFHAWNNTCVPPKSTHFMQIIPEGEELLLEAGDTAFLSTGAGWVLVMGRLGRMGAGLWEAGVVFVLRRRVEVFGLALEAHV